MSQITDPEREGVVGEMVVCERDGGVYAESFPYRFRGRSDVGHRVPDMRWMVGHVEEADRD